MRKYNPGEQFMQKSTKIIYTIVGQRDSKSYYVNYENRWTHRLEQTYWLPDSSHDLVPYFIQCVEDGPITYAT